MAPNFLYKLVNSRSRDHNSTRSPSPPTRSRHTSLSVSSSHSKTLTTASNTSNGYASSESSNPNVTVIPPSPRTSTLDRFDSDPPDVHTTSQPSPASGTADGHKRVRSLQIISPTTPTFDVPTPRTSTRPSQTRDDTIRPLSQSSSVGNLRTRAQEDEGSVTPMRSMTTAEARPRDQRRKVGDRSTSAHSSRSRLRVQVQHDAMPQTVHHDRSVSSPPLPPPSRGDGNAETSYDLLVESPTSLTGPQDLGSPKSYSDGLPSVSLSSTLLAAPDNSDATSMRSVSSTATTSKKRSMWRRGSVNSGAAPVALAPAPTFASLSPPSKGKSPNRKPTGLASALAASGLAMVNPGMPMPPVQPTAPNPRKNSTASRGRSSSEAYRDPSSRSRPTSDGYSEYSDRDSYRSYNSGSEDDDEDDDMDLSTADIPVTGFAVASNKRNFDFHELFPDVPEGDYLIEDYGCALQREILVQGRLYVSENHVCFHASIFGWITNLTIAMCDVTALEKRMTAFVIPNAIQVTTTTAKYTFTSFLSRDTTFDVIYNVWKLVRPEDSSIEQASMNAVHGAGDVASGTVSPAAQVAIAAGKKIVENKVTQCICSKNGQHFAEKAMEVIFPGTPEKIYNLMFTSGFIKDFMRDDQKLIDIQISDWMPTADNPLLLCRNMSYIKPLSGGIGPKQTKCELRDETVHADFDEYVVMLTTTRTPDVPSGGVFSVKTKTCITWASSVSTKVLVTTEVEWTGRSFIKGIIERSCLDGQKTYHADLDKAMRAYIHAHQSEFIPEGVDPAVVEETEVHIAQADQLLATENGGSETDLRNLREKERDQRGLQWAYDTFEGAMKVARQSAEGALDLIKDGLEQSSTTTILYIIIAVLVVSNIWTLMIVGQREETGRRKEIRRTEEKEKWVQEVVTTLWGELVSASPPASPNWPPLLRPTTDWKEDISQINQVLDLVEARVRGIRDSLKDLD